MRKFIVTLIILSFATQALAWSRDGHAIVGVLAERQLRPAARAEVARLLAGEADPTLSGVAAWADDVRASEGPGKSAPQHYINFKGGGDCDYVPVRDCPDGNCVIGAINRNFLILSDRTRPDAERRDALKYLVHFVGDVHQPLHSTPRDDKGGGDFQVSYQGKGSNLHKAWDRLILERKNSAPAEYAKTLASQPALATDVTLRSDRPAVEWALESCRIVRDGDLYPSRHVIDDAYLDRHAPIAEQRLRLAGNRLADMINRALAR
jgi:nuclease S1